MRKLSKAIARRDVQSIGLLRWLTATGHKDIGTLYLVFALALLFVGGGMALALRAELFAPGLRLMGPHVYNQLLTLHALIMIFGAVLPALSGLASWQIPLMIGAPDMAFPRVNALGFWLLPFACALLLATLFLQASGGAPAAGWTFYPPLSMQGGLGADLAILAVLMLCVSAALTALNAVATVFGLRASGMTLVRLPMFVWTWLVAAFLLLVAAPALAGALLLQLGDRHFGTQFFDAAGGGDPRFAQHLFWFFGNSAEYILILPAVGIVSQILPTFARKPLFGHVSTALAVFAAACLALIGWGSHMVATGLPPAGALFFMYGAMLAAVPASVVVFNWIATLWRGSLSFETPMLFALAFVLEFTLGGLAGLVLALAPLDLQHHDTQSVVAHAHTMLVSGALFAILGGAYYWLPRWTGRRYDERLGKLHFWLSLLGANLAFLPQYWLGAAGMSRRIPDYALQFTEPNRWSTVGAFLLGLAQLIFLYVVVRTVRGGRKADVRFWEGARGLEWTQRSAPRGFGAGPRTRSPNP